jgi:hypothetical protein
METAKLSVFIQLVSTDSIWLHEARLDRLSLFRKGSLKESIKSAIALRDVSSTVAMLKGYQCVHSESVLQEILSCVPQDLATNSLLVLLSEIGKMKLSDQERQICVNSGRFCVNGSLTVRRLLNNSIKSLAKHSNCSTG